jgi:hypothetical protein
VRAHGKKCDCPLCVQTRLHDYLRRIDDRSRAVPGSRDQTVPVRAHWRRHPGHLRKQPNMRKALLEALSTMIKKGKG